MSKAEKITKAVLQKKIAGLGDITDQVQREVVCALIGHSRIQSTCFGYYYCGRCQTQLGDSLGSLYPQASNVVIIGHNCKVCRSNYRKCTWQDKYMVPDPFKEEIA